MTPTFPIQLSLNSQRLYNPTDTADHTEIPRVDIGRTRVVFAVKNLNGNIKTVVHVEGGGESRAFI